MQKKKIYFLDTTLRDGTQNSGINFSLQDKIRIATALANFGLDFIEAGFPGSNPKDEEFFRLTHKNNFASKLTAFSATYHKNKTPQTDALIQKVLAAQTKYVTVFGKTWDFQTSKILGVNQAKAFDLIYQTIRFFRIKNRQVIFDAEHFFDGFKANPKFALACLKAAEKAGAFNLTLCDTNGGTLPAEISEIFQKVQKTIKTPLGIHAHNDSATAVANCLNAVQTGANLVQTTINGIGERIGNADYNSVLCNLQLKLGYQIVSAQKLKQLTKLSKLVAEIANLPLPKNQPFTGENAFRHKGGIHVSAVQKFPNSYEHIKPDLIGQVSSTTISELAGKTNVVTLAKIFGLKLKKDSLITKKILTQVKELENNGFYFETAEASFILLVLRAQKNYQPPFLIEDHLVVNSKHDNVTAMVKVRVGKDLKHFAASSDGPVDALNLAVRRAVIKFFPIIQEISLVDYKVRILDSKEGTAAKIRVLIESQLGQKHWTTVGCSTNIILASLQALNDALEFAIWQKKFLFNKNLK